ncbi:hypothetical protein A2W14_03975 [Candidatus Gottesmanbacteria bacterium RBG_16_37_8]|uniref:Cobalt ABC transporter permease n=1 Tax=Candidatus Gottesmanbacteria bacterium RBG_16_37_8 TaxID=1798371 RepID=A0A1F5YU14_9BACT|nr:MAG: hypothetical protein A2W14_03975 [Candidatus Gottesmanbacteria bacterium RBG_16_37_8]
MKENIINLLKITAVIIISSILAVSRNLLFILSILLILSLWVLFISGLSKLKVRLYPLLFIALAIIIFNLLFNSAIDLSSRLVNGITTSLKIMAISLMVFLYTEVTAPSQIIKGLFFLPYNLRLALTMTFSLIPILLDEIKIIKIIQQSRGYKKKLFNPIHNILPVVIPLLHRTFIRAEQISLTIYSRGYGK